MTLHGVPHGGHEFLAEPRLGDEAKDFSLVDRFYDGGKCKDTGDQNARAVRLNATALHEKIEPHHFGHPLIGDDDGETSALQDRERFQRTRASHDMKTIALEGKLERVEYERLVIDDENRR